MIYNALNVYASNVVGGEHPGDNDGVPKAFVNILFFDKSYDFVDVEADGVKMTQVTSTSTTMVASDFKHSDDGPVPTGDISKLYRNHSSINGDGKVVSTSYNETSSYKADGDKNFNET